MANVRAAGRVSVQVGHESIECAARVADADEVAAYWPSLVSIWPAYETHLSSSGERTLFVLEPIAAP